MALTTCTECQTEISDKAPACPKCGAPRPKKHTLLKALMIAATAAFVLFLVVGTLAGNSPEAMAKNKARGEIKYCWEDQARKTHSAETARFIAGACEAMEAEFRSKWRTSP